MTDLLKKPVTFEKVEFWAATAAFFLAVFTLLAQIINADANDSVLGIITAPFANQYGNADNFLPQLARYATFYAWFVAVDLLIIQGFIRAKYAILCVFFIIVVCIGCAISLTITDTWLRDYIYDQFSSANAAQESLFKHELVYVVWLLILLGFYTVAKQIVRSYLPELKFENLGGRQLINECLIGFAFLALSWLFFRLNGSHWTISTIWCGGVLYAIIVYWFISFKIIPQVNSKRLDERDYTAKVITVLLALSPFFAIAYYIQFRRLSAVTTGVLTATIVDAAVGLLVVAPLVWYLNRYRLKRAVELQGLKTELGQSSANLDFLRSQINPHFLFNALNTLYGTALQENAERTGGGIQKLGDMMRFMLQENLQDKISLAREVDYLNNYIDLQKLRTQTSPDILIQTEIDEEIKGLEVAPMLLIPFVENAFKHGISLREPSHIKISLQTREKVLYFDVTNSIHPKSLSDPERDRSGIGLENVKQRLQLLYPGKHELAIRESAKEFFIHLTVTLAG